MSAWVGSPAELGPDREFAFTALRWHLWSSLVVFFAAAFNIGFRAWIMLRTQALVGSLAPWAPLRRDLILTAIFSAAVAAMAVGGFVHSLLLLRRGLVLVSRVGLAFTDWRGQQHRVFWAEVRELRIVAPLAGVNAPFGRLDLRSSGGRVVIPYGLTRADWGELRDLTLGLAGLTETGRRWWGVVYTRPER
jgi:hypothetical protein